MVARRNILKELYQGMITAAEVESNAEAIEPIEIAENWGLSKTEWTAYCQGAGWNDLVQWRYSGWPTQCALCGINLPNENSFGWFVIELSNGSSGLRHIGCSVHD